MGSDTNGPFYSRAYRFDLKMPIFLDLPEGRVKGRSLDVSESGMLAFFEQPLDVWLTGRLSAVIGGWQISINVRVARVDGRKTGLNFLVGSRGDLVTIQKLIELAANQPLKYGT
jgi:hypothetical protein